MPRNETTLNYRAGKRRVTVHVTDTIGVEDIYSNQMSAVLYRYAKNQDLWMPAVREVKNHIILQNVSI